MPWKNSTFASVGLKKASAFFHTNGVKATACLLQRKMMMFSFPESLNYTGQKHIYNLQVCPRVCQIVLHYLNKCPGREKLLAA